MNLYRHIFVSLAAKSERKIKFISYKLMLLPSDMQRPEDFPLWSYFGRDVPGHIRTKIGRIKFLTYFGSAMSGMHLASENIEKFPRKAILFKLF